VVARASGQRDNLFFQLLDQALLMRRDNIHTPG
jgi:hypothetical protein